MDQKEGKILIADDEPDILEIISYNLRREGYEIITAKDGEEALQKSIQLKPNLIVLDVMMPGKNGMELCKMLRALPDFRHTLIIFLTALNDELSHVRGLEYGADDYISKPVSPKILVSKINALFRRIHQPDSAKVLQVGNITIDPVQYIVLDDDREIILAKKEFELLYLLATQPGKVFNRNELLSRIWGNEVIVGDRTIDVHIRKIRQKLGMDYIFTVKGLGYKFVM
ncbi:MAG: response regulator transcription factor [Chitinophagaceae bacterium]|nr:response regulator transcription factor [Chitinophagaceae bacterium]